MTTATVNPEKVLKDLRELWVQLAREQESGVLRACAMTLIVIAEDDGDAEHVRQTLGVLMHDHPSRAIVLKAWEGAELGARVFAECWMPFGRNQQICSEGIEMTADAANLGEVAQLLLPLIVPDLPVVLWCRGARFFSTRYFDPLFPLAHKIVVDSVAAKNPKGAIAVLKELRLRGERLADLEWTRLTGWRQALANVFDDAPMEIAEARVGYAGAMSTGILYFLRWMERSVPGRPCGRRAGRGRYSRDSDNCTFRQRRKRNVDRRRERTGGSVLWRKNVAPAAAVGRSRFGDARGTLDFRSRRRV